MTHEDMRRWVDNYRAAEELQRDELRRNPPTRETSIRTALELIAVAASLHGWPFPQAEQELQEDERISASWAKLRAFYLGDRAP